MADEPRLSRTNVGAWVVKCNPQGVWDYFAELDDSGRAEGSVDDGGWTLGNTYRNELLQKGDLVVLWVGGTRESGIHEIGRITGPVHTDTIDDRYLIDESRRGKPVDAIPFRTLLLAGFVARADMKVDKALRNCEPLRAPRGANPSYLTPTETSELAAYFTSKQLKAAGWATRLKKLGGKG
jgi:hypothetical protein